jgi:hypothetical protein
MSDDENRAHGNVRRVTAKNRKETLDYGQNLFPPESPLTPDARGGVAEPGEPLPFDDSAFVAQAADRFPPLPFDGDEPAAFAAQEAERFPPLPPPAWARHEAAQEAEFEDDLAPVPPPVSVPAPVRGKARKTAPKKKPSRARGCLYNLLTLLFFALTIGALIYGIYIFQNPFSPLNPLPPATSLPIMITATPAPLPTDAPTSEPSATPLTLDLNLMTEEAPAPVEIVPTATYTPLPPEMLTELAPVTPTPEDFTGEQAAT